MKAAFYKGTDRLTNALIAWKLDGPYSHCEAVFGINPETGLFVCASSSYSDGGVRFKEIDLRPDRWDIIEVPGIDAVAAADWYDRHDGEPYDVRGLISFIIPVGNTPDGWFCNEALGAAFRVPEPQRFDPTSLACVLEQMGGAWVQGGPPWMRPTISESLVNV